MVSDERELVVQAARGEEWVDLYGVTPSPVPLIDVETANWMTSTPLRRSQLSAILERRFGLDAARVPVADQATPRPV